MILTDDFVFIHQPKTGGTFVTRVIERLYGDGRRGDVVNTHKHAGCTEIPAAWRGKPIFTTIRNPYDRYVSQYRFAWWKRYPEMYCGEAAMRDLFPHYPELSFAEFLELAHTLFVSRHHGKDTGFHNLHLTGERRPGWHTEQFLRLYAVEPRAAFAAITDDADAAERCRRALFPVRFLTAENLNAELHAYLGALGHPAEAIEFVRDAEKIYPAEGGRPADDAWQAHYTAELKHRVRTRERLLFALFPQYDG
ncbi:MAG TPA: sulfotransferase family 2 domain-containing protein [Kofleriaceae bacterium]|nr:sulfotransferase family 2 domain-containing protein [Kofleriaceae bacterium]